MLIDLSRPILSIPHGFSFQGGLLMQVLMSLVRRSNLHSTVHKGVVNGDECLMIMEFRVSCAQ